MASDGGKKGDLVDAHFFLAEICFGNKAEY